MVPTDSYAPGEIQCPSNSSLTRNADSLSPQEQEWLKGRSPIANENLISFLNSANMTDFDPESFINGLNRSIKIGLSFSGVDIVPC